MIERLTSVMQEGNRKFPLRYRRMINCLADRFNYVRSCYLFGKPMQTPGTELLRFFIMNLNVVKLDEYATDVERYTEVIKFFKNQYLQAFDPVMNGSIKGGKFISVQKVGGIPPPEIILNVDCENPLTTLPMEKPWADWMNLRGLRLLYHDSLELIERFTTSMFEFRYQQPSFMVFALDVPILLFKYYKYWKDCALNNTQTNANEFLKRFEYAQLFDDMIDVWTLNLLTLIYKNPELDDQTILSKLAVPQRICTPSMLTQGILGAKEFVTLVKQGQVKPQDFLETHWFDNESISEKMATINQWCSLPNRRQYLWCNAVLWLPYLDFIMTLTDFFPDGMVNQLIKERSRELWIRKFKYAKMPGISRGEILQDFITKLQTTLEARLNK